MFDLKKSLSGGIKQQVINRFDHKKSEPRHRGISGPEPRGFENMAVVIWQRLRVALPPPSRWP
ncbi:MAG: hypothetical protein WKG07_48890 [Hymenobacter sp.]